MDYGCPHEIETPFGTITFNETISSGDLTGCRIQLTGIKGVVPSARADITNMPSADGVNKQGDKWSALYPILTGEIRAPNKEARTATRRYIDTCLKSLKSTTGTWTFTEYGQDEEYYEQVCLFGDFFDPNNETGEAKATFTISLLVKDPTRYEA